MSARGIILVVLCAGIVVLANLALRVGLDRSGVVPFARGIVGLPGDVLTMLLEPVFCLAVVLYGFSMLLWLRLVATEPLSLAYPMLAAVTFVSLSVVSIFLLAEPMGLCKAAGLAAIVCRGLGACPSNAKIELRVQHVVLRRQSVHCVLYTSLKNSITRRGS